MMENKENGFVLFDNLVNELWTSYINEEKDTGDKLLDLIQQAFKMPIENLKSCKEAITKNQKYRLASILRDIEKLRMNQTSND